MKAKVSLSAHLQARHRQSRKLHNRHPAMAKLNDAVIERLDHDYPNLQKSIDVYYGDPDFVTAPRDSIAVVSSSAYEICALVFFDTNRKKLRVRRRCRV